MKSLIAALKVFGVIGVFLAIAFGCSNQTSVLVDFKGIKIGQSQEDVEKLFVGFNNGILMDGYLALTCNQEIDNYWCSNVNNMSIANHIPNSAYLLFFSENLENSPDAKIYSLTFMRLSLDEKYFEDIALALTEKYGKTSKDYNEPFNDKLTGAKSIYRKLTWIDSKKMAISISNYVKDGSSFSPRTTFEMYDDSSNDEGKSKKNDI